MMRVSFIRVVSVVALLTLAVVACGQKGGVHIAGGGGVGPAGTDGFVGPGGVPTTGPGGVVPTTGPGGVVPTTGPGGVVPTTGPGGQQVVGGDRTGITATEIVIGIHAPTTGAAPVQGKAFEAGSKLYWQWLHQTKKQTVFGRRVRVLFRDDQYTPTSAVAVCNEMATAGRSFLIIGGAGTDQINACADYAERSGIPYLSPGVQEAGLVGKRTYFAVSMSYKQQMQPLAQLLRKEHSRKSLNKYGDSTVKVGFVRPNTPNFNDADAAFRDAVRAMPGFSYKSYPVSKEGRTDEAQTVGTQVQTDGVDVIVPITPPVFTIQMVGYATTETYRPLYAGVGITNNINQAIDFMCEKNEFEGAIFFSPWGGWKNVMAGAWDSDFGPAAETYAKSFNTPNGGGDILLALWGIMKTVHRMFLAAGGTMSRQSFAATLNNFSLSLKVFPDLRYTPTNHLGAQNVHVLLGDCDSPAGPGAGFGDQWIDHPDYPGLRSKF